MLANAFRHVLSFVVWLK